jgi:hypothetical protein
MMISCDTGSAVQFPMPVPYIVEATASVGSSYASRSSRTTASGAYE